MEKKITTEYVEKILREGKEVIFQEERSLQKFKDKFKDLQTKSKEEHESK